MIRPSTLLLATLLFPATLHADQPTPTDLSTFRQPTGDWADAGDVSIDPANIVHNGKIIHANQEVTGPTRSAAFNDEKPTGPLMFQGDHGPVAYRNIRLKPLKEERRP